ncbi:hypothetical protein C8Q78DRAFT_1007242 [Trametes maxima]|nr:hypothetical protein C8Q78DRAFT_1007242 [Trametes maxima]
MISFLPLRLVCSCKLTNCTRSPGFPRIPSNNSCVPRAGPSNHRRASSRGRLVDSEEVGESTPETVSESGGGGLMVGTNARDADGLLLAVGNA